MVLSSECMRPVGTLDGRGWDAPVNTRIWGSSAFDLRPSRHLTAPGFLPVHTIPPALPTLTTTSLSTSAGARTSLVGWPFFLGVPVINFLLLLPLLVAESLVKELTSSTQVGERPLIMGMLRKPLGPNPIPGAAPPIEVAAGHPAPPSGAAPLIGEAAERPPPPPDMAPPIGALGKAAWPCPSTAQPLRIQVALVRAADKPATLRLDLFLILLA